MGVGVKLMSMFRAGDHENYRHYCASDLGKHAAGRCDNSRPVIARDGGLSLRMGYEKMIASRCGTVRDRSLLSSSQASPMKRSQFVRLLIPAGKTQTNQGA